MAKKKQNRSFRSFILALTVFAAIIGFVGCEYQKTGDIESALEKLDKAVAFTEILEEEVRESEGDYEQVIKNVKKRLKEPENVSTLIQPGIEIDYLTGESRVETQ